METKKIDSFEENEPQVSGQQISGNQMTENHSDVKEQPVENPPSSPAERLSFITRHRLVMKAVLIAVLTLILLIPMSMIEGLISEREQTAEDAAGEVYQKWSGSQTITGPMLTIPFCMEQKNDKGELVQDVQIMNVLPEKLEISSNVKTEELKRGLYEIVVYDAPIELKGEFILPNELKLDTQALKALQKDGVTINMGISDLRGISEQVEMKWNNVALQFNPGIEDNGLLSSGVVCKVDIEPLLNKQTVAFSIKLHLKGSDSLLFVPLGKTTVVDLASNCATPSFTGTFLPNTRTVNNNGFKCNWKVMNLNRNYSQVLGNTSVCAEQIANSAFGVNMLMPVQHYQKSMRSVKYAMLIILLTFVVSFFVEILQKKQIHPLQYLLIGLALCLFYTLLISISEHTDFSVAYAIASTMTVVLITLYMAGVLKIKKTAVLMGALLLCLYIYIFVLIQMQTYALLAGSVGLFVILAVIMYVSQRIKWDGRQ